MLVNTGPGLWEERGETEAEGLGNMFTKWRNGSCGGNIPTKDAREKRKQGIS